MHCPKTLKPALTLLAASVALGMTGLSRAEEVWKFQINVNAGDDQFKSAQLWADDVARRTEGEIRIDLLPSSAIVGNSETLEAVGVGILQGHITDPSYFAGMNPAFAVYGNMVGAWSDPKQMLDYMHNHGGEQSYNQLVEPYNVHLIRAGAMIPEALVSKRPIETLEDFKGLKVRAPEGMVSNIFQLVGASPVNLPTSEVYTALEKGVIDAADYTVFATNYTQGYQRYAPYAIYPGFHSMPMMAVSINKDIWDGLSAETRKQLEDSVDQFVIRMRDDLNAADAEQIEVAKAEGKVQFTTLSQEQLKQFRQVAQQEWARWRDTTPAAEQAVDGITAYLKAQGLL